MSDKKDTVEWLKTCAEGNMPVLLKECVLYDLAVDKMICMKIGESILWGHNKEQTLNYARKSVDMSMNWLQDREVGRNEDVFDSVILLRYELENIQNIINDNKRENEMKIVKVGTMDWLKKQAKDEYLPDLPSDCVKYGLEADIIMKMHMGKKIMNGDNRIAILYDAISIANSTTRWLQDHKKKATDPIELATILHLLLEIETLRSALRVELAIDGEPQQKT